MSSIKKRLPDWLIVNLCRSLLGEIYPEIRAIAVRYNSDSKELLIRYYLDRKPTEIDFDNISCVETELYSAVGKKYINKSSLECLYSDDYLNKLDILDGLIYARKET